MNRRVFLCSLAVAGCARADWIGDTLVTVDVTGRWTGTMPGQVGGNFIMNLRQTGPKATGDVTLTSPHGHLWSGPIEGTVSGDGLRFSRPDGSMRGELVVT